MTIGERIKAARKAAGLTQLEFAERIGVSFALIHQYESGILKPEIGPLQRIADELEVDDWRAI